MRDKCLAILLAAILLGGAPARAAFQEPIVSPESAALGHTSLTSQDSSSLFSNPAQLASMKRGDFYFMHNQMYAGMEGVGKIGQNFISAGMPTRLGSLAFGVGTFKASGLYEERTLAVSYAKQVGRVAAGVTAKHLNHSYEIGGDPLAAADPVFRNGSAAGAFALDAGAVVTAGENLRLGLAARNINRPDIGLAVEDRVPREVQGGLAYDFGRDKLARLTADVTYREEETGDAVDKLTPAVGVQKGFGDQRFVFRMGLTPHELTAGFGLRLGIVGLDYALVLRRTLIDGSLGTHMLGLKVAFGGGKKEDVR